MRAFAELYARLDATTSTNDKMAALSAYFSAVPAADGAWTVALLSGRRPKKPMSSTEMKRAVTRYLGVKEWVVDETHPLVGDLGETIALLIDTLRPPAAVTAPDDTALTVWMEERIPALAALDEEGRYQRLTAWWRALGTREIFVLQKLIGGSFRVGASETVVVKALAAAASVPVALVTQRITGKWTPTAAFYRNLMAPAGEGAAADPSQPFPFALAYPLDTEPQELGDLAQWAPEWKWDGIRAQIIRREGACYIWSRGEDLVTNAFPELATAAMSALPEGTVLDGEILAFAADRPLPFAALQKRLGRKKVTPAVMAATPLRFLAYDLLELAGTDWRDRPFGERRQALEALLAGVAAPMGVSPLVQATSWDELRAARADAREQGVEGLMLKRRGSPYRAGRKRGDWWKWKVDPLVVDAVLIYAQAGSGRRANLFTDYTFAVWDADKLVPVAKAYSGLDAGEIGELDRWIRAHTKEKFGPVRSVEIEHVFELGFEGIQESGRHKAGVALRFPRILRWRKDKRPPDADSLGTLKGMLDGPR